MEARAESHIGPYDGLSVMRDFLFEAAEEHCRRVDHGVSVNVQHQAPASARQCLPMFPMTAPRPSPAFRPLLSPFLTYAHTHTSPSVVRLGG
jgi:hypothetical protein